jgi:hypothetical protein
MYPHSYISWIFEVAAVSDGSFQKLSSRTYCWFGLISLVYDGLCFLRLR